MQAAIISTKNKELDISIKNKEGELALITFIIPSDDLIEKLYTDININGKLLDKYNILDLYSKKQIVKIEMYISNIPFLKNNIKEDFFEIIKSTFPILKQYGFTTIIIPNSDFVTDEDTNMEILENFPGYFWAMNSKLVKNAIFELDNTEKAQLQDYSIRKNFFKEIKKNIKTSKSNKTILIGLVDQI